jgi:hypothetical protein
MPYTEQELQVAVALVESAKLKEQPRPALIAEVAEKTSVRASHVERVLDLLLRRVLVERKKHVALVPARRAPVGKRGTALSQDEADSLARSWTQVRTAVHEHNPVIIAIAGLLDRSVRGVENQFICFRALERSLAYGRVNVSTAIRSAFERIIQPFSKEAVAMPLAAERPPALAPFESKNVLHELHRRSFGGADVAADPLEPARLTLPEGPSAPGAQEAVELLADGMRESGAATPLWVFLVGAAGNGKSHLARLLLKQLNAHIAEGGEQHLAKRLSDFHLADGRLRDGWPTRLRGKLLRLVNDATIPRVVSPEGATGNEDGREPQLVIDAHEAAERRSYLLVNVNRGIILENISRLSFEHENKASAGVAVIRFLNALTGTATPRAVCGDWVIETTGAARSDYLDAAQLRYQGELRANITVVHMDQCSLFERRPETLRIQDAQGEGWLKAQPYQVSVLHSARDSSAAGQLLGGLVARMKSEMETLHPLSPERANIENLLEPTSRSNLLTTLRAAEIASSRRFTYRDVWGAFGVAILGREASNPQSLHEEETLLESLEEQGAKGLEAALELSRRRMQVALFQDAPLDEVGGFNFPRGQSLQLVDPVLNSLPSGVREELDILFVGERAGPGRAIFGNRGQAWTAFDRKLEEHVMLAMTNEDCARELDALVWRRLGWPKASRDVERVRRWLSAWFCRYIIRLHAILEGRPGHSGLLEIWCAARGRAKREFHLLSSLDSQVVKLSERLRTFVLPTTEVGAPCLLDGLSSRVEPVRSTGHSPQIVFEVAGAQLLFEARAEGDEILVVVREEAGGRDITEFPLDFALLREAMAVTPTGSGFTESSREALPRIERARAALANSRRAIPRVVGGGTDFRLHGFEQEA